MSRINKPRQIGVIGLGLIAGVALVTVTAHAQYEVQTEPAKDKRPYWRRFENRGRNYGR